MLLAQQALRYGFALVSFYLFVCLTVCMCYCLPVAQLKVPPLSLRELLKQQAQCVIWEGGEVPVFKAPGQQNVFFSFVLEGLSFKEVSLQEVTIVALWSFIFHCL